MHRHVAIFSYCSKIFSSSNYFLTIERLYPIFTVKIYHFLNCLGAQPKKTLKRKYWKRKKKNVFQKNTSVISKKNSSPFSITISSSFFKRISLISFSFFSSSSFAAVLRHWNLSSLTTAGLHKDTQLGRIDCMPAQAFRIGCSPAQAFRIGCMPVLLRRVGCSPEHVRRVGCSPEQVRHIGCSPVQVRHIDCSPVQVFRIGHWGLDIRLEGCNHRTGVAGNLGMDGTNQDQQSC